MATAAALLCFGVAGGLAGERATGPGSFATAILDALYALDRDTLIEKARATMTVDVRLNAIVDPERANGRSLAELARMVVAGGATLIQLRDKHGTTRQMIEQARAIKAALAGTGVPLVVNDRVDVALIAEADGVHVGQDDMRVEDARRLLGPKAIIGLSIKSVALANAAPIDQLDYVGVGGVYATTSKDNPNPPIGVSGLRDIVDGVPQAQARPADLRHRGDRRRQCGGRDCGRRGRRRGDLGAVDASRSRGRGARIAQRRRPSGAGDTMTNRDRRHHRGLGLERRAPASRPT